MRFETAILSNTDIVIRPLRLSDAPALAVLRSLPGYRYGTLRLPFETEAAAVKRMEEASPGSAALAAVSGEGIVGEIGLMPGTGRRRHSAAVGLGVHDDFVGRGVGRMLMDAALDLADNWLDLSRLELTVFVDNEAALALYRRVGFVEEGRLRKFAFRDGEYVDAFTMARIRD